jgi:colanic acid/amylovoran biosynthesis protein
VPSHLIVNAYSARNAGDAAIMLATVDLIRVLNNTSRVDVGLSSRYADEDAAFYADYDVRVVGPIIPFPARGGSSDPRRVVVFAGGLIAVLGLALLGRWLPNFVHRFASTVGLGGAAALAASDKVLMAGGGYLYSSNRRINLTLIHAVATTWAALAAGKPVHMMPQSIGPLTRSRDRFLVRTLLRALRRTVAREELSVDEIRSLDRTLTAELCPDVAFFGWWPRTTGCTVSRSRADQGKSPRVRIVAMDWTWARPAASSGALDAYVDKLVAVVRGLLADGVDVRLMGHSSMPEQNQDDLAVARRVLAGLRDPRVQIDDHHGNLDHLVEMFADADLVIGTRLHSCILSIAAGTPAVALAYQPKASGTYRLLNLERFCVDVEHSAAEDILHAARAALASDGQIAANFAESARWARTEIQRFYTGIL